MVIRIVCGHCSYIFYSGDRLVSIEEVIKKYGNKCPKCLREIMPSSFKISIKLHHEMKPV